MSVIQHKEFTGTFPMAIGSVAFDSPVTAGSTIVVCVTWYDGGGDETVSVSDNVNGAHTLLTIRQVPSATQFRTFIAYRQNCGSGTTTVTVDPTGTSNDLWFSITEISCPDATSFDADTGATGTGTNAPTVNLTVNLTSTIVFGVFVHNAGGSDHASTEGTGYTLIHEQDGGSTVMPGLSEYQVFSSSGSKTVNGTIDTTTNWAIAAASFEQAAASVTRDPAQGVLTAQGLVGNLGFTINMPAEP